MSARVYIAPEGVRWYAVATPNAGHFVWWVVSLPSFLAFNRGGPVNLRESPGVRGCSRNASDAELAVDAVVASLDLTLERRL